MSLATKVKTGSGLPAGPGGLLGAAEGLSFLAIVVGLASGARPSGHQLWVHSQCGAHGRWHVFVNNKMTLASIQRCELRADKERRFFFLRRRRILTVGATFFSNGFF